MVREVPRDADTAVVAAATVRVTVGESLERVGKLPIGAEVMTGDVLLPMAMIEPDDVFGDVASAVPVASASTPFAVGFRAGSDVESVVVASTDALADPVGKLIVDTLPLGLDTSVSEISTKEIVRVDTMPPVIGTLAPDVPGVETDDIDETLPATTPLVDVVKPEVPIVETGSMGKTLASGTLRTSFEDVGMDEEAVVLTWGVVITPALEGIAVKLLLAPESVSRASAGRAWTVLTAAATELASAPITCCAVL